MRVKIKTIMAGPGGCFSVGSIVDVSSMSAKYLVATGQAEAIDAVAATPDAPDALKAKTRSKGKGKK